MKSSLMQLLSLVCPLWIYTTTVYEINFLFGQVFHHLAGAVWWEMYVFLNNFKHCLTWDTTTDCWQRYGLSSNYDSSSTYCWSWDSSGWPIVTSFARRNKPSLVLHLAIFQNSHLVLRLRVSSCIEISESSRRWVFSSPHSQGVFVMYLLEDVESIVDLFCEMRQNGLLPNTVFISKIIECLGFISNRVDFWNKDEPIPVWKVYELQE